MGVSTDAKICYGIAFPEEFRFPWSQPDGDENGENEDGDPEEWWREINGYVETPKVDWSNYNEDHMKPEWVATWDAMHAHQKAFDAAHPMPFEAVYHCSNECTMYILAVPGTETVANRGDAKAITPEMLSIPTSAYEQFVGFIDRHIKPVVVEWNEDVWHGEKVDLDVHWYLCSYWG